ncbi:MAG: thioredoxin [Actinobacteria bacterium]|nr:MAG: thioredoxin [Actinomycetota bacterium]
MSKLVDLSDQNFNDEVIKSDAPVLVDFYASWCQPCQSMKPIIEELAASVDSIKIGQLNVDDNPNTAEKYQVMSIPTFIMFVDGKAEKVVMGSMNKEKIKENFNKWLV